MCICTCVLHVTLHAAKHTINEYEVSEDLQGCSVLDMFRAGLVTPNMSWS